jgi:hypothetical protein
MLACGHVRFCGHARVCACMPDAYARPESSERVIDGSTPPAHYVESTFRRVATRHSSTPGGALSGRRRLSVARGDRGGAAAVRRLGQSAVPDGHSILLLRTKTGAAAPEELEAVVSPVRVGVAYMKERKAPRGENDGVNDSPAAAVLVGIACVDSAAAGGKSAAPGPSEGTGGGGAAAAACVTSLLGTVQHSSEAMDAVLAYLAPPQFAALATTSPRGPRFLLSIAAAVGTECAQRALVELLLARTAPDAVLGPYAGQVDPTHHVVDAMTDVEEPTAALLDALLLVASRYEAAGLEGTDKHTQVMFAIGAVGRLRPADCGSRRGARRALEDALTKATAASDHTEAEYAKYRAVAEEEWQSWPRGLQGKWMSTVLGWSHRGAGRAWATGTDAERALWANATVDAMARQYARDYRTRDRSRRRLQDGDSDISNDLHAGVDAVRCAL